MTQQDNIKPTTVYIAEREHGRKQKHFFNHYILHWQVREPCLCIVVNHDMLNPSPLRWANVNIFCVSLLSLDIRKHLPSQMFKTKTKVPLSHLCYYIPLIAQLILPHEVRLLKLHFPQNRHVWVDPDPQERRVSTAYTTGDKRLQRTGQQLGFSRAAVYE